MDMNQDKLNEKAAPAAEKPGEAAPAAPDEGRAEDKPLRKIFSSGTVLSA